MTGRVLALAALVAVWLLTLASAGVEDAALGVLLAAGVALGLRPPPLGASRRGSGALARIAATPRLLAVVLADSSTGRGTWPCACCGCARSTGLASC
jgi:hypothetical protein